jgi:hypothetical protein
LTTYERIEVLSWGDYLDPQNENNPFTLLKFQGYHEVVPKQSVQQLNKYEAHQIIGYQQLMLFDTYDLIGSSDENRSGYVKAKVKQEFKVRICFRVVANSSSRSRLRDFIDGSGESIPYIWNNRCLTKIDEQTRRPPFVFHDNYPAPIHSCTEFTLNGGDEFEFDIDSNFNQRSGSSFNVTSLKVNGKVASSKDYAIDSHLIVSIHEVFRESTQSPVEVLSGSIEHLSIDAMEHNYELKQRLELVQLAAEYIGDPFHYGGNKPKKDRGPGTDCSGFVLYILNKHFPTLKWSDTTSSKLSKKLPVVTCPTIGDLVFTKNDSGKVVHVDFYYGEIDGNDSVIGSVGTAPNTGVNVRQFNPADSDKRFYCSITSICFGETIPEKRSEEIVIEREEKSIMAIQAHLSSIGLYSGDINGRYCEQTKQGIITLQAIYIQNCGVDPNRYRIGEFNTALLSDIKRLDLGLQITEYTNIQALYNAHQELSNAHISTWNDEKNLKSFSNPFSHFEKSQSCTFDSNQLNIPPGSNLKMKLCNGWSMKLEVWGPADYFQNAIQDYLYHPNIGACYNNGNVCKAQIELKGGDEIVFFKHQETSSPSMQRKYKHTKLPQNSGDYQCGYFHLLLNQSIASKSNVPEPSTALKIEIKEIKSPINTDWEQYSLGATHDWGINLSQDSWRTSILESLGLDNAILKLDSPKDSFETNVQIKLDANYSISGEAGIKVVNVDNNDLELISQTKYGIGIEFGNRVCGWANYGDKKIRTEKPQQFTQTGGYAGVNLSAGVSLAWVRHYRFKGHPVYGIKKARNELTSVLPYGILSSAAPYLPASWLENQDVRALIDSAYSKSTLLAAIDVNGKLYGGLNFDIPGVSGGLSLFNLNFKFSLSGKFGGFITWDYHERKRTRGMILEVNLASNAGVSVGLYGGHTTASKLKRRRSTDNDNETGANDIHSNPFDDFLSFSRTIKSEIVLDEEVNLDYGSTNPQEILDQLVDDTTKHQSSEKVAEMIGSTSQIDQNSWAERSSICVPIKLGGKTIEVEISFKSTVWSTICVLKEMSIATERSIMDIMYDLSENHIFEDIKFQVHILDEQDALPKAIPRGGTIQIKDPKGRILKNMSNKLNVGRFGISLNVDSKTSDYSGAMYQEVGNSLVPKEYSPPSQGFNLNTKEDRQRQMNIVRENYILAISRLLVL